jgi:CheY-like chemotaxis protein
MRAREHCPDLIAADVFLLEGTGIRAVQEICCKKAVPVMFITRSAETVYAALPQAVVVSKPVNAAELRLAYLQAIYRWELGKANSLPA